MNTTQIDTGLITRSEAHCDLYLIVAAVLLHDVIDDKLTRKLTGVWPGNARHLWVSIFVLQALI